MFTFFSSQLDELKHLKVRKRRGGSRMLQAFAAERLLHDGLATTRKDCNAHYQGTIGNLYENGKLVTVQSSTQTP